MGYDAIAAGVASTLSDVFGVSAVFARPNQHESTLQVVIRKDAEVQDEAGQLVVIENVVSFAVPDLPFTPKRDDTVTVGTTCYTLGRRLSDNGYRMEFEATT